MTSTTTSGWDPTLYLTFTDQRLRPALDLMARVPLAAAATIHDLGCGPGNVTRLLAERWPAAHVTGIDASPEMLARARAITTITWEQADLAKWRAPAPADLVYSNAALHWLDDHAVLFPHLVDQLRPGGVLAVQMPRQHLNPTHRILFALAREARWGGAPEAGIREFPVADPGQYYAWLGAACDLLDLWEVEYLHVLEGENAVLQWVMGSVARPVLDKLAPEHHAEFLKQYGARLNDAYPPRADGKTLLPFRRLFLVAQRRA